MKRIVLVADDYGQASNISHGILNLVKLKRLSGVSCMVNCNDWKDDAKLLQPYNSQISVGLHFNLTHGQALSREYINTYGVEFKPLTSLLINANLRRLQQKVIEAELNAQLNCFVEMMGFMPHHLDGHQHIHQFPVIRGAMINVYSQKLRAHQTYIRLVNENVHWRDAFHSFKKIIIHISGTKPMRSLLTKSNIPHNQSFSGIYNFSQSKKSYRKIFNVFLSRIHDGGMIMCHPGLKNINKTLDIIAKARVNEYAYFASDDFLHDCHAARITLVPSPTIIPEAFHS